MRVSVVHRRGGRGPPEEWVPLGGGCEAAKAATS